MYISSRLKSIIIPGSQIDRGFCSNPEDHTVMCALMKPCIESGYSVLVTNGSGGYDAIKLDNRSNKKAEEYIRDLHQEDDIYVHVTGTMRGDTLKVTEIKEAM